MESKKTFTRTMLQEECGVVEVNDSYFVRDVFKQKSKKQVITKTYPSLMIQKSWSNKKKCFRPHYIGLTVSLYNYKTSKYINMSFAKLRMIWELGEVEMGKVIDHIDTNPLNNQLSNLRLLSEKENQKNRKLWKQFESIEELEGKSPKEISIMIQERIDEAKQLQREFKYLEYKKKQFQENNDEKGQSIIDSIIKNWSKYDSISKQEILKSL